MCMNQNFKFNKLFKEYELKYKLNSVKNLETI